MANANSTSSVTSKGLGHIADDIACALSILRDLMAIALEESPMEINSGNRAASVLWAARRYVDDIESSNERLFELMRGGAA